jgi:hypothetical protein
MGKEVGMDQQTCKPQDLELQITVFHLYKPRLDGEPDIQVAGEVYYPDNVDGYYCEKCDEFFDARGSEVAATEESVQGAWQRALHHLHEAAQEDRRVDGALLSDSLVCRLLVDFMLYWPYGH